MESEPRLTHCLDCGEPLTGVHCSSCGQKGVEKILPLRHLLHEIFHELWHVDARFLRTLWALARPGFLTQEYVAGRRTRWFPPFRLYLIASLALFLLISVAPSKPGEFHISVGKGGQAKVLGSQAQPPAAEKGPELELERKANQVNRDPAAFIAKFMAWLPRVLFLLLPFFALLLKLAYLRTRTLYAVHAVFSLHEHAFVFLLLAAVRLLGFVPYAGLLRGILMVALPVHLLLALKRVYGQGWTVTLVKAAALSLVHGFATIMVMAGTALFLLWVS